MTTAIAYGTLARVGLGAGALGMGVVGIAGLSLTVMGAVILFGEAKNGKAQELERNGNGTTLTRYLTQRRSQALALIALMVLGGTMAGVASFYVAALVGKVVWVGAGSLALKTPLTIAISGVLVAAASVLFSAENAAKLEVARP